MADTVIRGADTADFTFVAADLTPDVLKVAGFTGEEGVSRLYSFRLDLVSDDANLDFNEIVGKPCLLEIAGAHGSRYVNGIVRQFEQTGEGTKATYYAAEIVPLHWLLTKRVQSRIYLEYMCSDMTVPGIIQKVLEDAGIPAEKFRFALQATYNAREFVVQYRESDFDFISRLAEHEGIFYFFEHTADGHVMVFGDSPVAHVDVPADTTEFPFKSPDGLVPEKEYVYQARDRQSIQISKVTLDDFNFKQPANALRAGAAGDSFTQLEYADHPGEYDDNAVGDRIAKVRLEEHACAKRVVNLAAVIRALIPGFKFKMVEHQREALNIEYLVLDISHRATQPQAGQEETEGRGNEPRYDVDIRAIPADVPYRAPRVTPRPTIVGSQTALVVGPSGEEIYTDDDGYGRVKVQFHWDLEGVHDENSSAWIRVAFGWAGGNYGMIYLPRVGQEVIVNFIEGNPDHPIITGRVYNNDNMPPYKLPDEKTKSTMKSRSSKGGGGFNELRFEDKKDSEQIFMHGQKDLDIRIKEVEKDWIGKDKHEIIGGMQAKSIGGNEGRSVGGDCGIKVKGKYFLDIGGTGGIYAAGHLTLCTDADFWAAGVKAVLTGDSYAELSAPDVYIEGTGSITLKSGGSCIKIEPGGVTIVGGYVNINSGGGPGSPQDPGSADEVAPAGPAEAATGDPGKDFTYQQEAYALDPLEDAPTHDESESTETQIHWIGVRLFDDNGLPMVGERYNIKMPDGTHVAKGQTNEKGEVEVRGIDPGSCEVTFPDLDGMTWETGPAVAGAGGGAPGGGGGAPAAPGGGGMPSMPNV